MIEPFGERNRDHAFGIIGALVANMFRDSDKNPKPYTYDMFMTPAVDRKKMFKKERRLSMEQSKEQVISVFRSLAAAMKGKNKKGKN